MGISSDGIVFYGFLIEEESKNDKQFRKLRGLDEDGEGDEKDTEDVVAALYGWDGENPQYAFEWEKKHPSPVTIGLHCSFDYPMYYVAIKKSEHSASRGYPEAFDPTVKPDWDAVLDDFCKKAGMKAKKYGWFVTSLYG